MSTTETQTYLQQTLDLVVDILGDDAEAIGIERAVLGLFFTGVKLDTGHTGLCATPLKQIPEAVCCPSSAMAMPFPGKVTKMKALRLAQEAVEQRGVRRAVGIAALNALAHMASERRGTANHQLLDESDAFAVADVQPHETAVVVGAFGPFLKALRRIGADYYVLEMDPATLKPEEMPHFRPANTYRDIVPKADVVLITGTTLINDTLADLVACARPEARIVLVGPTMPMLPDAFFARPNVIVGTVRVTDPDALLDILAEGGSGYHFFGRSADKIVMVPRSHEHALATAPDLQATA